MGPSPSYSYSAQVAEVTVDPETGHVRVDKIVAAHDCGKALNPMAVEGQVIGSVYMGFGQAMQEEMIWHGGRLMNPSLLEYRIPTTLENPEIDCIIVESEDPEGPFGAKEAGEGSLAATIPAISNAIYDAVGVRIATRSIFAGSDFGRDQKNRKQHGNERRTAGNGDVRQRSAHERDRGGVGNDRRIGSSRAAAANWRKRCDCSRTMARKRW